MRGTNTSIGPGIAFDRVEFSKATDFPEATKELRVNGTQVAGGNY